MGLKFISEVSKRAPVDIVEVDTSTMTQEEVGILLKQNLDHRRFTKGKSAPAIMTIRAGVPTFEPLL